MPAEAGIQWPIERSRRIPAFAGMTCTCLESRSLTRRFLSTAPEDVLLGRPAAESKRVCRTPRAIHPPRSRCIARTVPQPYHKAAGSVRAGLKPVSPAALTQSRRDVRIDVTPSPAGASSAAIVGDSWLPAHTTATPTAPATTADFAPSKQPSIRRIRRQRRGTHFHVWSYKSTGDYPSVCAADDDRCRTRAW
jgi:hypothetical protein